MPTTFFDANVAVGLPRNAGLFDPVASPADLGVYLSRSGLSGALVWHWTQAESHPASGNGLLPPYLKVAGEIYPCWAALPPATAEPTGVPSPGHNHSTLDYPNLGGPQTVDSATVDSAAAGPIPDDSADDASPAALRLFPEQHRYLMNRTVWGDYLDQVTERRIPVLLSLEHGVTWPQVYDLLRDFPELTCVLCDLGAWSMDRYTYPLLEAYPNLVLETSMLSLEDGGVEGVVERFGAGRLVFGTGFPKRYAEAAILQLSHAEIGTADRQAIAADNMLHLLEGENR